ncbi:MAG: hypothetical protein QMD05_11135 [Candidatus Brocadiaceae bacterium]|nr:hypothetical protein [Candidatus Brocadiaceae bacterium]
MNFKDLIRSKTFWAGVASIVAGIEGIFTGVPDMGQSIMLIVGGFMAIFLRQAVEKSGVPK